MRTCHRHLRKLVCPQKGCHFKNERIVFQFPPYFRGHSLHKFSGKVYICPRNFHSFVSSSFSLTGSVWWFQRFVIFIPTWGRFLFLLIFSDGLKLKPPTSWPCSSVFPFSSLCQHLTGRGWRGIARRVWRYLVRRGGNDPGFFFMRLDFQIKRWFKITWSICVLGVAKSFVRGEQIIDSFFWRELCF